MALKRTAELQHTEQRPPTISAEHNVGPLSYIPGPFFFFFFWGGGGGGGGLAACNFLWPSTGAWDILQ